MLMCSYGSTPRAWELGIMRDLDTCGIGLPSAGQYTMHHGASGRPRSTSPLDSPVSVAQSRLCTHLCYLLKLARSWLNSDAQRWRKRHIRITGQTARSNRCPLRHLPATAQHSYIIQALQQPAHSFAKM